MIKQGRWHREGGFSLLWLSIWLIALGLAVTVVLALLPNQTDDTRIAKTITTMQDAQDDLLAYVVKNYHLPEPDTNGDGSQNAGATSGALPYRDMGLPAAVLDEASLPLRYAPYRNSAANADLTALTSLYDPTTDGNNTTYQQSFPTASDYGCTAPAASPINLLDFCVALDNAANATASTSYANTGPGTNNVAYVLVSGGLEDANGNGLDSSLDGANEDGDLSFEDPARGRGKGYDDIVRVKPFSALQRALSCDAALASMRLLEWTAIDSKNLADNIAVQDYQAGVQLALDSVAELLRIASLGNAGFALAGATESEAEVCATAAACLGLCANEDAACAALTAAVISDAAALAVAVVDLAVGAVAVAADAAVYDEVHSLNTAARQHVCDVIDDVTNADQRGGLATSPQ